VGGLADAVVDVGPETTMVTDGLTASGLTPLVAVTVKVEEPGVVGIPDNTPVVAFNARPGGSAPADTVKVGAGLPEATKV
jgi:hypothetical protein